LLVVSCQWSVVSC